MKELCYGIFCEDVSQKTFIIEVLKQYQKNASFKFVYSKEFSYKYKGRNSEHVLKTYVDACIIGFRDYSLDLFFVGVDYDDRDRAKFKENYNILYNKLPSQTNNKTIIFFPVQAIEHWMLFIKYKIENPKSTKNISLNIEKISRVEAKKQIYGNYTNKELSEKITTDLSSQLDINWLKSKSESFKFFVNKLETAIKKPD